ncbi:MAG: hypothetical protein FIB01_11920 [Gemmatimonadetes bacterium]|nr:hypothetical protein [Gemmatimonadota bacterium]
MTLRFPLRSVPLLVGALTAGLVPACAPSVARVSLARPATITDWRSQPPLGYPARADRRNLPPGDTLRFGSLGIAVLAIGPDSAAPAQLAARLQLLLGAEREERDAPEGAAFNWRGYHVAVVAIGSPGELGAGLVSLEVAELASLPPEVANSSVAGGAGLRLRIPHEIRYVTLHHTGDAQPLRPEDDPIAKLRALQSWGAADRNWWDLPYHLLLDLDGRIYAGRDWHYMGETNTTYDPRGHLLISVIGNYQRQEPTPAQLSAIADIMAWAVAEFGVPLERIGGHYNYADTDCPGRYFIRYLEDGTFRRMVQERLDRARRGGRP